MHYLISTICLFITSFAFANDSLIIIKEIPMHARLMTVDELGNIYVVKDDNSLVRYSDAGDSSAFYRSVQNGDISFVDASNPLKIVVYYALYNKVVLLDKMLAQMNEMDLRKLNIFSSSVVASSADGNLWVYDPFNAKLKKIDEQFNEKSQSNDIRQEAQVVPSPTFMVERDWKVFLCDTANGIFIFDRYANYVNTIDIFNVKYLQVYGSQLLYRHQDSLYSWDMNRITSNVLLIPHKEDHIINAALVRSTLYVLYDEKLVLYHLLKN